MRAPKRRLAGVLGAAAVMTVALASPAPAAVFPHDGHRAADDGCRADQKVIYHVLIKDTAGTAVGYVDLMYSVYCHTAWAHVHGVRTVVNQTWVPHGLIHRNYDGVQYSCTTPEGAQDCWTPMVYDKGMTSYARGTIDPNGATNTQYTQRTPNY
jgi:hypothetical protein